MGTEDLRSTFNGHSNETLLRSAVKNSPVLKRHLGVPCALRRFAAFAVVLSGAIFSQTVDAQCYNHPIPPDPTPFSGSSSQAGGFTWVVQGRGGNVYANTGDSTMTKTMSGGGSFSYTVSGCVNPIVTENLGYYTTDDAGETFDYEGELASGGTISIPLAGPIIPPKNHGCDRDTLARRIWRAISSWFGTTSPRFQ